MGLGAFPDDSISPSPSGPVAAATAPSWLEVSLGADLGTEESWGKFGHRGALGQIWGQRSLGADLGTGEPWS